jgi:hypothetical protein
MEAIPCRKNLSRQAVKGDPAETIFRVKGGDAGKHPSVPNLDHRIDPQLTTYQKGGVPMKRSIQTTAIVVILITCFAALVWAEGATKEEVVAKCEAAGKLIQEKGVEVASQTIGDKEGPFVWKDTYVFLMDLDGKMLAHPIKPELTERADILEVKDTEWQTPVRGVRRGRRQKRRWLGGLYVAKTGPGKSSGQEQLHLSGTRHPLLCGGRHLQIAY